MNLLKETKAVCPKCDSENIGYLTQIPEIDRKFSQKCNKCGKGFNEAAYYPPAVDLSGCITVGDMIEALKQFDPNLPILHAYEGWVRENEYMSIDNVELTNLWHQNTGGDPEFYGQAEIVLIK
jgi:hypothetical protein